MHQYALQVTMLIGVAGSQCERPVVAIAVVPCPASRGDIWIFSSAGVLMLWPGVCVKISGDGRSSPRGQLSLGQLAMMSGGKQPVVTNVPVYRPTSIRGTCVFVKLDVCGGTSCVSNASTLCQFDNSLDGTQTCYCSHLMWLLTCVPNE